MAYGVLIDPLAPTSATTHTHTRTAESAHVLQSTPHLLVQTYLPQQMINYSTFCHISSVVSIYYKKLCFVRVPLILLSVFLFVATEFFAHFMIFRLRQNICERIYVCCEIFTLLFPCATGSSDGDFSANAKWIFRFIAHPLSMCKEFGEKNFLQRYYEFQKYCSCIYSR